MALLALELGSIDADPTGRKQLWAQAWSTPLGGFQALLGPNVGLNGALATGLRAHPTVRAQVVGILRGSTTSSEQTCREIRQLSWQVMLGLGEAKLIAALNATPWVRLVDKKMLVATADEPQRWQLLD
jgi:hypothetical protein